MGSVKPFLVYTLLRTLLFAGVLAVIVALWILIFCKESSIIWPVVIALLVSGGLSYFLLNRQRQEFAEKVDARARRASARFDQAKAKEDED